MLSTIKLNDKNDLVKVAKYLLNYSKIKEATDTFDEAFQAVVIDWQKQNQLEADGIIGKNSWTKIAEILPTCSTSKFKTSSYTCAIQILLGGLDADGIYGTKTKNAIAAFQSSTGLEADGICGPKTWKKLITGSTESSNKETSAGQVITENKVLNNCVKYLQWDSKWKKVIFTSCGNKSQNIGNSGCGPSSMAMIMATFIDPSITPVEMCKLAVDTGCRTTNSGTSWKFFKIVFQKYPEFEKYVETGSVETLKAALREGALAVCSMNGNDNHFWTSQGHFIVARGCDNTYIYANDPNKSETPRKQTATKFQKCMKQAFIFWPKKKFDLTYQPQEEKLVEQSPGLNGKIIDISKWQGNIDFAALKKEVGLVIARASCGSDKDIKIDEYAQEMIKYNIPFGVYCYSYAGTVEKAKDEAQKMITYAEKYNPLFYIMDAEEAKITTDVIRAFAQELRARTSKKIGCYVAHHRYKTYKYDTLKDLFDITWIPCYGKNDGTIAGSTKPSYDCDLWQYTSTAKIAGINGNVDMNITMKEERPLAWFLQK